VLDQPITTRLDDRWPQGLVGRRDTRIVKNARIYSATADEQVVKVGWGDLCLEQWHELRAMCGEGLLLVAFESGHSARPRHPRPPSPNYCHDSRSRSIALQPSCSTTRTRTGTPSVFSAFRRSTASRRAVG